MAPRARQRKRDKRMDAAVEMMKMEYQISDEELVKKVANELVDAYGGGDVAWGFIEQYQYIELLEAIVRYQDKNAQENNRLVNSAGGGEFLEGNSSQGGTAERLALENSAGPSSVDAEPVRLEVVENGLQKDTTVDTSHLPSTERDGKSWKDIGLDESSSWREISNVGFDIDENSGSNEDPGTGSMLFRGQLIPTTPLTSSLPSRPDPSPLLSPLSMIPSPTTANSAPPRRRVPCYGWIESDEEDYDYSIELKPAKQVPAAPTTESGECKSCGMESKAKRRSRWDLRPDDP